MNESDRHSQPLKSNETGRLDNFADRELEAILTILNAIVAENDLRVAPPPQGKTPPGLSEVVSSPDSPQTANSQPQEIATAGHLLKAMDRIDPDRRLFPSPNPSSKADRPIGRLQRLMNLLDEQEIEPVHPINPVSQIKKTEEPKQLEPQEQPKPDKPLEEPILPTMLHLQSSSPGEKFHVQISELERQFKHLAEQVWEPTELINPLLPLITELLRTSALNTREGLCDAIVPIIDVIIRERTQQDRSALSAAISALIPDAITREIQNSPEQIASAIAPELALAIEKQIHLDRDAIANALAPEMGKAIKAQIHLERDAMVDALYPVIGNTISKYMVEVVREINAKVENTLSMEGVSRKIRAGMQGISEAELILRESVTFNIEAIFLIHKSSGLIIAETQKPRDERLESEMIAGMLTAIRSFANDCVSKSGHTSELHEIEYGNLQIILEVAGYCYLAVVVEGDPSKLFIEKMRQTLSTIVEQYDRPIQDYDGDPDTIPAAVSQLLEALMDSTIKPKSDPKSKPPALAIIGGFLLLAAIGFGGRSLYHQRLETQALSALERTPELAVYRLDAQMRSGRLELSGKLPNRPLQGLAEKVVQQALPKTEIDNTILAVEVPADPVLVEGEVQRLVEVFNRTQGIDISANYVDNQVRVWGQIDRTETVDRLTQSLENIPGVRSVAIVLQSQDISEVEAIRIYFEQGSSSPISNGLDAKIELIRQILDRDRDIKLRIIGHSDRLGTQNVNQKLSRQRAEAVETLLVQQGVSPQRLQAEGIPQPPGDVSGTQSLDLSRCVRFELLESDLERN
ncbi:MAG: OmpA family protein [Geitlerinemataceae cyanobacterium]